MSKNGNGNGAGPIKPAIYARKSTDQDVAEDAKSVTRQIEQARAFAESKGWIAAPEHIYVDDGISGALDESKRPGLRDMLAAADRRSFEVLIVAADDRLARDQWTAATILARLSKAGIRLFYYQERREVDLSGAVGKFMEAVRSFGSEFFRESQTRHMVDALMRKAKAGHVHGGTTFGYRNVPVDGHVERQIIPEQAAVILRIFTRYAHGIGLSRIAEELNADAAPSSSKSGGWQPGGWTKASVREVLYREAYHGLVISRWGDEEIRVEKENMRIIPEPLWTATRKILDETRQIYLRQTGGKLYGKPSSGIESHYLLTGMMSCAACGSVMTIRSRKHGRRRAFVFMCQSNIHGRRRQRQPEQCRNNLPLPMPLVDQAILDRIGRTLLHPDVVTGTIRECLARLDPSRRASRRQALETERKRLERELANLTTAIAGGDPPASLVAEIKKREARVQAIVDDLDLLGKAEQLARLDLAGIEPQLRERLNDWRGLLTRHVQSGRQILRKLVPERLVLTPHIEQNETWYSFTGVARLEPLLSGIIPVGNLHRSLPLGATTG